MKNSHTFNDSQYHGVRDQMKSFVVSVVYALKIEIAIFCFQHFENYLLLTQQK